MRQQHQKAFSLVELLVVIGIITLLISILLPAIMSSRRSARTAVCLSNLRQLGLLYRMYAMQNDERLLLGVQKDPVDEDYHAALNLVFWQGTSPGVAGGVLLSTRMISPRQCRIFYCPLDSRDVFNHDLYEDRFNAAVSGVGAEIPSGYSVRPVRVVWRASPEGSFDTNVPLPKLSNMRNRAIVAEHPQLGKGNHGGKSAPSFHALYADGSVKPVLIQEIARPFLLYCLLSPPKPPGYVEPSNLQALNEADAGAETIWRNIDRQY